MKKIAVVLLFILSCGVYLDSVDQPSSVEIGESFTLTINGNYEATEIGGNVSLGIMLPIGFVVDSVVYYSSDTIAGVVTEVDSALIWDLEQHFPSDSQMCWQAFSRINLEPVEIIGTYVANIYGQATASTVAGTYLIDYRSGYDYMKYYCTDSILDQPMEVTETCVKEIVEHSTNKNNVLWPTIFKNKLNIFTNNADQVEIFSEDGRLVKSFNLESCILDRGSAISWDGTNQANRQLASGVYFVKFISGHYEETEKVLLIR